MLFSTSLLSLGIYLPLLTREPLLTYRFGRVQETVRKAVSKGLRITVGYALLLVRSSPTSCTRRETPSARDVYKRQPLFCSTCKARG